MVQLALITVWQNRLGKLIDQLKQWANHHEVSLCLLVLLFLLRLPNLAEPYWYGDEAIYLTIGHALRHGLRLYADIVDHKTPLIYWLAMVPNQTWFRLLLIGWMAAASLFFYHAARRLLTPIAAVIAGTLFVILTSLPALEGNVPNGELFVLGFITASLWLLTRERQPTRRWLYLVFTAGVLAGLGILTKVPALLDAGALASLFWFELMTAKRWRWTVLQPMMIFGTGVITAILASILYFWGRGTLANYLQFGLLYNLHYSQNWSLPFTQPILVWLFSLPGKTLILLVIFAAASGLTKLRQINYLTAWSAFWLLSTLFAALLSNRPYPHYLLQLAPPLVLSIILFSQRKAKLGERCLVVAVWLITLSALFLLNFRSWPLLAYYNRFWYYATGRINREQYWSDFNRLTTQNQLLADLITSRSLPEDRLFIWGTNPMLYALTQRIPTGRFTVSFHIKDLQAYAETLQAIEHNQPPLIIVMKEESPLPELATYLQQNYFVLENTEDMVLYRRFLVQ